MFDIAPTELLLCAIVALVVIGPKDLPRAMRVVGQWVGRARGVARHFRSGIDTMIREAEIEEMEKRWAAENERIMREHPPESMVPVERYPDGRPELPAPLPPDPPIDVAAAPPSDLPPSDPPSSDPAPSDPPAAAPAAGEPVVPRPLP
jgi:sec-independent protein translocase protein TatB